jgi:hypothetical protein
MTQKQSKNGKRYNSNWYRNLGTLINSEAVCLCYRVRVWLLTTLYLTTLQALGMLNNELELVKSMTGTLGSFMEDPSIAAGRQKSGGGASEQSRDPDVWPPPTPQEPRYTICLSL